MKKFFSLFLCLLGSTVLLAQKTIKEYVDKNSKQEIIKDIAMIPGCQPVTAKGFGDGHGRNPVLVSKSQIPDTVALVTLYIYDLGTTSSSTAGHWLYTESSFVSADGGNFLSNEIRNNSLSNLKEAFKKQGVVLLTPEEYLNTPEKKKYYYDTFAPKVSKLGKFLSSIENKNTDIAVAADNYRPFDIAAAADHLRAESLGGDLAKVLGVDGVLSIAVELQSNRRVINIHGVKMFLHGPNPIPKEDKKYVAQNLGNGYYDGQIYCSGSFFFKKPIQVGSYSKKEMQPPNFEGIGTIFESFVDKFHMAMNESIEVAARKYK